MAKDHETLWTKESYSNFVLDLDFKVAKESNSGVFLRSGNIKDVLAAPEIQVHENTDGSKYGMVAAIYDCMPPKKDMTKPVGEWNHYTITCKDSIVIVVFNGEEVIHADLNDWTGSAQESRRHAEQIPGRAQGPRRAPARSACKACTARRRPRCGTAISRSRRSTKACLHFAGIALDWRGVAESRRSALAADFVSNSACHGQRTRALWECSLIFPARFLHYTGGHEVLQLLVGAQAQHFLAPVGGVAGLEVCMDHGKQRLELIGPLWQPAR